MSLVLLLVSLLAAPQPPAPPSPPEVVAAVDRLSSSPLWPGFEPAKAPIAIFDGRRTWLFRHPSPPAGFVPAPEPPGAYVSEGRLPEITANSSEPIGGVVAATLLLTGAPRSADETAATAIHELFHVFTRERHPDWAANEVALLHYPFGNAPALALRRLEHEALRRALAAEGDASRAWGAAALALRYERFAKLPEEAAAYERATERNEGLAQFVEDRALGRSSGRLTTEGFGVEEIRQRGYATGEALALLLERSGTVWREKLALGTPLDALLSESLAGVEPVAFSEVEREAALRKAHADAAALEEGRGRRLKELLSRPGRAIVVVAKEGAPLFPERFDPWNLHLLTASQVLHGRSLKASNSDGAVEVFDRDALSEAAGADPLFTGMRRVRITGLAAAPRVTRLSGGGVALTAPGVSIRFRRARVTRRGPLVEVRVGEAR